MPRKPSITLVGSGRLATALGLALRRTGYPIPEVVSRSRRHASALARRLGARAATVGSARLDSDVIWLCITDDAIASTARALGPLTGWDGKTVFHSSGALSSAGLEPLRRAGARVASIHPMMTFASGSVPSLLKVPFGIEGDRAAVNVASRIARDLGGEAFRISARAKPLYHAAGSFASPLLIATLAAAEELATRAGIPARQAPDVLRLLLEQTVRNYLSKGKEFAFTGPIARGDLATIRRHLAALQRTPDLRVAYVALARIAVKAFVRGPHSSALRRLLK